MCSLEIFIYLMLTVIGEVMPKLLRVNDVHEAYLHGIDSINLDISLFTNCQEFTIVFTTESEESTRLLITFRNETLDKINVDSPGSVPTPSLESNRECSERTTKGLKIQVESLVDQYQLLVANQTFLRPRSKKEDKLKIFIPQQLPCCLIRAILFEPSYGQTTAAPHGTSFSGKKIVMAGKFVDRAVTGDPFARVATSTASSDQTTTPYNHPTVRTYETEEEEEIEESKLWSWTRRINERWIGTFLLFGAATATILLVFMCFGLCTFVCLQRVPEPPLYKLW